MRVTTVCTFSSLFVFAAIASLTGCSGFSGASFPDVSVTSANASTSLGTIQGSNFGGHAPLVGAHVYVLQPGVTGYGSQATSLLTGSTSTCNGSSNQICQNASDPGLPTSWYYMQSDSTGSYNITGDYTCVKGLPVYLYAFGGSPTYPSGSNSFSLSSVTVSNAVETNALTDAGTATYTFTTATTQNFYIGEPATVAGLTGNLAVANGTYAVTATNLTTTTFSYVAADNYILILGLLGPENADGTTSLSGATVTVTPGFNPSVANMAVLGVCPSSGNFSTGGTLFNGATFSPLKFVYMNEVSTVAAAFALQGFTLAPTAAGVAEGAHIGTAATSTVTVTATGGNYTAYPGIDNAALNAGQLYDIQGGNLSTSYAGEGHIARVVTPAGNGYIPQTTLDTLGNILAACVDSNNSYADGQAGYAGTWSPQCQTLSTNATSDGNNTVTDSGTTWLALDTASAAFNIARRPAGKASNTATFMSNLYSLPTGNVPFTPHITGGTVPNDFTIGIVYPAVAGTNGTTVANPYLAGAGGGPESVTIDTFGNVWGTTFVSGTSGYVFQMNPQGTTEYSFQNTTYAYGYVSIDLSNHAFLGGALQTHYPITTITGGSATTGYCGSCTISNVGTGTYYGAYGLINNSAGALLFPGSTVSAGSANNIFLYTPGAATPIADVNTAPFTNGTATSGSHLNVDAAGYFWVTMESSGFDVARFTSAGSNTVAGTFSINGILDAGGAGDQPEQPAIDSSNNAWIPMQQGNRMMKLVPNNTTAPYYTQTYFASGSGTGAMGATFNEPFGAHVDGGGILWVVNRASNSLAQINTATATALSPLTNYTPAGLNGPLNLAIDQSGDIWITNYGAAGNGTLTEVVGAAYPSSVIANQKPGVKP